MRRTNPATIGLPYGRALTVDDLAGLPDDGHRYELLDGTLLVSPTPDLAHQVVQGALLMVLREACPAEMLAIGALFAVQLGPATEFQPDVLVALRADFTVKCLPTAPLLAVEVRSPSTALIDLGTKKAAYERHGVQSYWIADPNLEKPSLTVFELSESGRYRDVGTYAGDETYQAELPFPVAVTPAGLAP